jgi:hypothetical protein
VLPFKASTTWVRGSEDNRVQARDRNRAVKRKIRRYILDGYVGLAGP